MLEEEVCRLYRELPISVLIFKDETLIHINKYLYEVFSVDELIVKLEEIKHELYYEVFARSFGISVQRDEDIHHFLSEHSHLFYARQTIQVNVHRLNDYHIFVLTFLKEPTTATPIHINDTDANGRKILNLFSKTKQKRFKLFSMYKGLHVKSDSVFEGISDTMLVFHVSKKHLASFDDNNEFIVDPNPDTPRVIVGNAHHIDSDKSLIYLHNLKIADQSAKERKTIRVKCADEGILLTINKSYRYGLYDLSLYSLAILVSKKANPFNVETNTTHALSFTLHVDASEHFDIMIDARITKIMDYSQNQVKVVFSFVYNEHDFDRLKRYINRRQMKLLRELKTFVTEL